MSVETNFTQDILVKVTDLSRHYGHFCAVDNINFELKKGEVLGFLGPNGAGKSTTMQMLCGVLAPSNGRIIINDIDLLDDPKTAKRHIGFLPEQPPLYTNLTVDEHLKYCSQLRGINKHHIKTALDTTKQKCGLSDCGKRLISNLSKGYQQRVGIAQAIIHSPLLVVLDEPTVGLDPIQILEIRTLIKELGNEHGVILSTHILPEVQITCDRVQIIHHGKLVYSDNMANLTENSHTSSFYIVMKHPPSLEELEAIEDVTAVEPLKQDKQGDKIRIYFEPGSNPAKKLVELSVMHNWDLQELVSESRTLEQIFVDLISTDNTLLQEKPAGAAA